MSSKPLAPTSYSFITLLWRDICDKMEQRERQNEPECSYCGNLSGVSNRVIYTFLNAHLGFSSGSTGGMLFHHDRAEGVRDTLAGRQTQRQPAVNY